MSVLTSISAIRLLRKYLRMLSAMALLFTMGLAQADILIGQTTGVSGAVAASVKETIDGAQLYLDSVNKKGGIRGEKIKLITLDDKFEPKLAAENARKLIVEENVVALFLSRGTPHTEAILPLLTEHSLAMVAPSTGAMLLHDPVNPYVFNVRPTYQREAEKAILHLNVLGMSRIAVVHVDDSFGRDCLTGANKGFALTKLQAVSVQKVDRAKPDYAAIIPQIMESKAQAVLWIGSGTAVADGIKALRLAGSAAQVVTLSNNASSGFIKQLGAFSRGVIVTQVFPNERAIAIGFVGELKRLATAAGMAEISPAMMEGFAAAKVLVEGLRRVGGKVTRSNLVAALENIKKYDLGGLQLGYSPNDHTGLEFSEMSIIGSDGKFKR